MEAALKVHQDRNARITALKLSTQKIWAKLAMDSDAFRKMSLDEKFPLFTKSLEDAPLPKASRSTTKSYRAFLKAVNKGRRTMEQKAQARERRATNGAQNLAEKRASGSSQPSIISVDEEDGGVSLVPESKVPGMVKHIPGTTIVPTVAVNPTVIPLVKGKKHHKKKKTTLLDKIQILPVDKVRQLNPAAPDYQPTNVASLGSSFSLVTGTSQKFAPYQPVRSVPVFCTLPPWRIDKVHRFASTVAAKNRHQVRSELPLPVAKERPPQPKKHPPGLNPYTQLSHGRNDMTPLKSTSKSALRPSLGPVPTEAYLRQCCTTPRELSRPSHLLIVLDLNGTLVYRTKASAGFTRRASLPQFLRYCLDNHAVMIWSSALPENVRKVCSGIFAPGERSHVVAEWGRDTLELSRSDYMGKVQVYKRLDRIWENQDIQARHLHYKEGGRWSQKNTVLIDDSMLKAQKQPFNHIEVSEFAMKKGVGNDADGAEVLGQVVAYLEELRKWEDVSAFIKQKERFMLDGGYRWDWETGRRVCPHVSEIS